MNGAVSESPKRRGVATIMICFRVITEGGFAARSVDELGSRLSFGRPAPVEPDRQERRPSPSVVGMAWDHDLPLPEAHRLLDCKSRRLL